MSRTFKSLKIVSLSHEDEDDDDDDTCYGLCTSSVRC